MARIAQINFLICICFLANGCSNETATQPATQPVTNSSKNDIATATIVDRPPLTEAKCLAVAQLIDKLIEEEAQLEIGKLTDWQLFLNNTMQGIPATNRGRLAYQKRFLESKKADAGLLDRLTSVVENNGAYSFLRVNKTESQWQLVYRLMYENENFNYMLVILEPDDQGEAKIVDYFLWTVGNYFSEVMRPYPIAVAVKADPGFAKTLNQEDLLRVRYDKDVKQFTRDSINGNKEKAREAYERLPEELQNQNALLMVRLSAAQAENLEDETIATLQKMLDLHPNEGWVSLMEYSIHLRKGETDEALKCLDRVDAAIGEDDYLNFYRAQIYLLKNDYEKANAFCDLAAAAEDDLMAPCWLKLSIALTADDHKGTLSALKYIDEVSDVDWDDLTTSPDYAEFVKSDQFPLWKEYLAGDEH